MNHIIRPTRPSTSPWGRVIQMMAVLAFAASACSPAPASQVDQLIGRYRVSAGGGTIPVLTSLTTRFTELHPGVLWDIENVGSDAAIASVQRAEADLGGVSREMTASEKQAVGVLQIGVSGTAIVVNVANPIANLTQDQIRKIFAGDIKDWSQLGGPAGEIKVFVREPTAATRQIFDEVIFGGKAAYRPDYTPVDSAAQTTKAITSFKDSISMLTITEVTLKDTTYRLVPIGGVAPTIENLQSGTYPMRRPLYAVYNTFKDRVKPAIGAFIDFTKSPEGQKIISGK
ncbi:MAG: phosphate ABC transporter substrate-binding protein [Chloroflexota bacterium]